MLVIKVIIQKTMKLNVADPVSSYHNMALLIFNRAYIIPRVGFWLDGWHPLALPTLFNTFAPLQFLQNIVQIIPNIKLVKKKNTSYISSVVELLFIKGFFLHT